MIVTTATFAMLLVVSGSPAAAADSGGSASLTIEVSDGGTKVHNKGGTWVSVTPNAGKTQVLAPGTRTEVGGGVPDMSPNPTATASAPTPPSAPSRPPSAPSLLSPADGEQVKVRATDRGPGQATVTWTPVAGAREYAVEFTVDNGKPIVLKTPRPEAKLPPIPGGKVAWAVRAVGDGAASELSSKRWFQLQAEPIKLEAKGGGWK
jgi:hypothetical protein